MFLSLKKAFIKKSYGYSSDGSHYESDLKVIPSVLYSIRHRRIPNIASFRCVRMDALRHLLESKEWMELYRHEDRFVGATPSMKVVLISLYQRGLMLSFRFDAEAAAASVDFLYGKKTTLVNDVISFLEKYLHREVSTKVNPISLIVSSQYGLETKEFDVDISDFDVELHYGKDFIEKYERILSDFSSETGNGIVLFHGLAGTGKTSMIKYLTTKLKKKVMVLPPYLTEELSSPNFIPFLIKNKNSILIIEDAEKVILDRNNGGSISGVSNLLNISDGILGDCLNIKILATFNTERSKIDDALLRKGRLIAEHKFDKLSVTDANALLKHLNRDMNATEPMTLAEIYSTDKHYVVSGGKRKAIGFTQN